MCAQAYLDVIPDLDIHLEDLVERFRGWKFADTVQNLEKLLERSLPETFETTYRQRVDILFQTRLKLFDGVYETLDAIKIPMCIASSGPQAKIKHSLSITKITRHFTPHIFSAYDINAWKPEPDLFLHAARQMGFKPENCLVIEDSEVGLQAAYAAGMPFLHFDPARVSNRVSQTFHNYNNFSERVRLLEQYSA